MLFKFSYRKPPVPAPRALPAGRPFDLDEEARYFSAFVGVRCPEFRSLDCDVRNNKKRGQGVHVVLQKLIKSLRRIKHKLCFQRIADKLVLPFYFERLIRLVSYCNEDVPSFLQSFIGK